MYLKPLLLPLKCTRFVYSQQTYCHSLMTICMRTSVTSLPPAQNTTVTGYHCSSSVTDVCNIPQIWGRRQVTVTGRHVGLSEAFSHSYYPSNEQFLTPLQMNT